jgi:hypothetical protein
MKAEAYIPYGEIVLYKDTKVFCGFYYPGVVEIVKIAGTLTRLTEEVMEISSPDGDFILPTKQLAFISKEVKVE